MNTLMVKHNMEVAHRLSMLPGKCEQIHGHSMQVQLSLVGAEINENGIAGGIDFGALKKEFRAYIDHFYDHQLHLNKDDPWARQFRLKSDAEPERLPGLVTHPGDPTVENLAMWICQDFAKLMVSSWPDCGVKELHVDIRETGTNGAGWSELLNANQ